MCARDAELLAFSIPGAIQIPLGQLRGRLGELDKNKHIVVFCAIGVRAYNAARILNQHGFGDVSVYPGGARFYQSTHYKEVNPMPYTKNEPVHDSGHAETANIPVAAMRIDCSGMQCPGPIMKVFETMKQMKDGQVMEGLRERPRFRAGYRRLGAAHGQHAACQRKTRQRLCGAGEKKVRERSCPSRFRKAWRVTERRSSSSPAIWTKVLASFIIANGAARDGETRDHVLHLLGSQCPS